MKGQQMDRVKTDDGGTISLDEAARRLREARRLIGSMAEIGHDADIDLLTAEQSIRRALRKIRAE